MTPSDAELVQQALAGSQQAYQGLVKRYATPAVNLATRMVRDRAVAEELAQEAFARAFEHLSTYNQQRRFVSWFFQILHNVTIDYIRRKQPTTVSLDELGEAGFLPVLEKACVGVCSTAPLSWRVRRTPCQPPSSRGCPRSTAA